MAGDGTVANPLEVLQSMFTLNTEALSSLLEIPKTMFENLSALMTQINTNLASINVSLLNIPTEFVSNFASFLETANEQFINAIEAGISGIQEMGAGLFSIGLPGGGGLSW